MSEDNSTTPIEMRLSEVPGMPSPEMELTYTTAIPMNGNTFNSNQEIRVGLNVPENCFVDLKRAYLKYKLNNTMASTKAYLDPLVGGVSVIDNFRVIGGTGALLEEIIHYNTFCAVMNANKNVDVVSTIHHLYEGAGKNPGTALQTKIDGTGNADAAMSGLTQIAFGESRVITHRPQSAFFNADRYLPLGYTQGLTYISMTLAQDGTAFIISEEDKAVAASYSVSEVELHLPILKPGPEFASMFRSAMSSGVPIQIHSVGVQNTQQAMPQNANSEQTLTFSTRKRSVKSLVNVLRLSGGMSLDEANSVSGFVNADTTEYNFSVGGMRIPAQRIKVNTATNGKDAGELLANTQLALGHYSSDLRGICSIEKTDTMKNGGTETYLIDTEDAGNCGKAVFALDLESYNASFAGKNLAGQGLPLVYHAQVSNTKGAQSLGALQLDLYVIHDVVYVLDGTTGVLTANS
tara:strand:- start:886 stop:2274 length:1389 start_codon:yes stop_codon:yes gene_type:complete